MVARVVAKLTAPLRRRVMLTIGRAVLRATREDGGLLLAQLTALDGEVLDGVPVVQEYGFASRPLDGAQGVIACTAGNRRGAIVIATGDRRYRVALAAGEAAIHDDLGQKVHLTRAGVAVDSPTRIDATAPEVKVTAATKMTLDSPIVEVTGALRATGEVSAFFGLPGVLDMTGFKTTYNGHTHNENDAAPGPTAVPNQPI